MDVSFVLATHDRRSDLLRTLAALRGSGLEAGAWEALVVDNASSDGSAEAVAAQHPWARLLRLPGNVGPCAKNRALPLCRGRYVMFLDDDSYPLPGSMPRAVELMDRRPGLGAAAFEVHLEDGRLESSAYPNAYIGAGTLLRRSALEEVGGLDESLFMQAEEYDHSFRLLAAGYEVAYFEGLRVLHHKSPQARYPERQAYLDIRNNLVVWARYLPDELWRVHALECVHRYGVFAAHSGRRRPFLRGVADGLARALRERLDPTRRLGPGPLEQITRERQLEAELGRLAPGRRRIAFARMGKHIHGFVRAARQAGLTVAAILEDGPAWRGRSYRGIPILPTGALCGLGVEAAVVSDTSVAHAPRAAAALRMATALPVHAYFGYEPRS